MLATAGLLLTLFSFKDEFFDVSRNLEIFSSLYREVNMYYVDPVDADKLMKTGIDAMLETLDPYTSFIPESEMENYRFMMTGQYGGIGALIKQHGDYIVVTEPYEASPAQRNDIRAGDQFLEVDGKSVKGKKTEDLSRMLKGTPGTSVKLLFHREGIIEPIEKTIIREEIKVKAVPFSSVLQDGIAYVKLNSFTDHAAEKVEEAIKELRKNSDVKGMILDLRGNPGGLLQEAVNVSNIFVKSGQDIVSTKGRLSELNSTYQTKKTSLEPTTPLVVLVNSNSASASEIVSGSLQDLDRAVIIGQRTYGKGLVQSTRPLSYNTQLKVTTSKYYIPSGRCIQALDYTHKQEDGSAGKIPDSLIHEFKTKGGRTVTDGGGILPDVITENKKFSAITSTLISKSLIFDYATYFHTLHDSIAPVDQFHFSEKEWKDFVHYLDNKNMDYTSQSEHTLADLKKNAVEESYYSSIEKEYDNLEAKLKEIKKADLEKNRLEITELLEEEIISRYYFQSGRSFTSLMHDKDVLSALSLLKDDTRYRSILSGKQNK